MLKSVMLTMLCLIFNWEVVPRSFWLKDSFLKDIMNAPLNKKKSKNKGRCHSTCTLTWNFWSASTLSRRCWLKFLTWPLMNLMLDEGWFLRATISNWDRGTNLLFFCLNFTKIFDEISDSVWGIFRSRARNSWTHCKPFGSMISNLTSEILFTNSFVY